MFKYIIFGLSINNKWTIDEVYRQARYLANKFGYNISPDDFNLMFPKAERQYKNQLYVVYGQTQRIDDSMSKFIVQTPNFAVANTGIAAVPGDLLHVDSLLKGTNSIQRVESDRLASHLGSVYDAPDLEFPIYVQYATTFQFYPVNIATVNLIYIKNLIPCFWNYTITNNRPVYNPIGSVQPIWSEADIDKIINIFLEYVGIKDRDGELENFAQIQEKTKA